MSTADDTARTWTIRSADDFGRALAGVRADAGLSQAQLAEMIGVHRSYVAEMEAGASVQMLERLLRAFARMGADVTVRTRR